MTGPETEASVVLDALPKEGVWVRNLVGHSSRLRGTAHRCDQSRPWGPTDPTAGVILAAHLGGFGCDDDSRARSAGPSADAAPGRGPNQSPSGC